MRPDGLFSRTAHDCGRHAAVAGSVKRSEASTRRRVVGVERSRPTDFAPWGLASLDPSHPALDPSHPALDLSHPALDPGQPALDPGHLTLDPGQPTLDLGQPIWQNVSRPWLKRLLVLFVVGLCGTLFLDAIRAEDYQKQPVYVGARVCAECHYGPGMGHQHSRWLLSKHASAYASLAKPEAKRIARLSGIPQEPQQASLCLGCHATGAHVEAWQRDQTFAIEDGVQCEKCHGPGSEYIDEEVMTNPQAAKSAGLIMPTLDDCMGCHLEKGSHAAVLGRPMIEMEKAMDRIDHPTPDAWHYDPAPEPSGPLAASPGVPQYTGAIGCAACHQGPAMGYQFSKWRSGPHPRAYATLATPPAYRIARRMGVAGEPQQAARCLKCHTTSGHYPGDNILQSYSIFEGVGCEACHGPGSEYSQEAVARSRHTVGRNGLEEVTQQTCLRCHTGVHGRPFDLEAAMEAIAHPTKLPALADEPRYKTPLNMAIRPHRGELYVTCEASHTVIVVDLPKRQKVAEISTGRQPTDVTFSPDGTRAYVSNRLDDSLSVIDTALRKVIATVPVGDEPHGVLTDASGKHLYVLNTAIDGISVIDTASLREIKRLVAGRAPWSLSRSPHAARIYATNTRPDFGEFLAPSTSEVTVIDTDRAVVEDRIVVPDANLLQGIDWHPSGSFALFTINRTKNLVPMTRLLQGWTITNGLGIVWADGRIDQVLLDEPSICFPDPTDVAITPDGRLALVTSSGSDCVAVVDLPKLIAIVQGAGDRQRRRVLPNHLGKPTEFVVKHIAVKNSPRGIVVGPGSREAYVANSLDDSITVIDLEKLEAVQRIDLGGPQPISKVRFGERVFHSAKITFHRQFSCHTCHPDGHVNGLTFDIEPDGIGVSPVDNRTLRGILDTAPFKWEGTNPSLQRQCGPRLAVFFTRLEPFTPRELSALTEYICTIPRPPNRHRPLGAELTGAQRRGKAMFERTRTNDDRAIPRQRRCVTCHFPPLYTDRGLHDVGTKQPLDRQSHFDAPHLSNIYSSAPYLHDGVAKTLEEIWTKYNPYDQHGVTNDMTKDQLNDLIEYLKTL